MFGVMLSVGSNNSELRMGVISEHRTHNNTFACPGNASVSPTRPVQDGAAPTPIGDLVRDGFRYSLAAGNAI